MYDLLKILNEITGGDEVANRVHDLFNAIDDLNDADLEMKTLGVCISIMLLPFCDNGKEIKEEALATITNITHQILNLQGEYNDTRH